MCCLYKQIFFVPAFYLLHMLMVRRHVLSQGRVGFTMRLPYMKGYTVVIIINFNCTAVVKHFYFFTNILIGYTVVQKIFPQLHMIVPLNGEYNYFPGCKWFGRKWF